MINDLPIQVFLALLGGQWVKKSGNDFSTHLGFLIFTPGIRMKNDSNNDQKRISTPDESLKNGANKIIMGRSLIKGNIEENIDKVSNSIKE